MSRNQNKFLYYFSILCFILFLITCYLVKKIETEDLSSENAQNMIVSNNTVGGDNHDEIDLRIFKKSSQNDLHIPLPTGDVKSQPQIVSTESEKSIEIVLANTSSDYLEKHKIYGNASNIKSLSCVTKEDGIKLSIIINDYCEVESEILEDELIIKFIPLTNKYKRMITISGLESENLEVVSILLESKGIKVISTDEADIINDLRPDCYIRFEISESTLTDQMYLDDTYPLPEFSSIDLAKSIDDFYMQHNVSLNTQELSDNQRMRLYVPYVIMQISEEDTIEFISELLLQGIYEKE